MLDLDRLWILHDTEHTIGVIVVYVIGNIHIAAVAPVCAPTVPHDEVFDRELVQSVLLSILSEADDEHCMVW